MTTVSYLGHSCFKIRSKESVLVCDPYDKAVGFTMMKVKADIVTVSHAHHDHAALDRIEGSPFIASGPGEYEVKGIFLSGIKTWHDNQSGQERGANTVFTIEAEGYRLCHLGDLGEMLSDKLIDELDNLDVLFIPVGGFYTLSPKSAVTLIEKIDPKVVIPMHFRTPQHDPSFKDLIPLEEFLKLWSKEPKYLDKLNLEEVETEEECQLVVLPPKL